MPRSCRRAPWPAPALASLLLAAAAWGIDPGAGYRDTNALHAAMDALAVAHADVVRLEEIGRTREDRPIRMLVLSDPPSNGHERPALLVVAGLDGAHLVGTAVALRVAERLAAEHADLLADAAVYVIPRVNHDGAERWLALPRAGGGANVRPVDDDRDGVADEDGPDDLDGNGVITMMRRLDPPLDDPRTHLADPGAPRLLKTPDAARGEAATYALYTEGLDDDGDGLYNEDAPGGVDLDRNLMRGWPEHARDAGPYPLSEPETHAVATLVLERPNIGAAIVYGRHDTVVNVPKADGTDETGRAPRVLHEDDVPLARALARAFADATGLERATPADDRGSLVSWLYGHRGLPTVATQVWARPDAPPDETDGDDGADEDDGAETTPDEPARPDPADGEAAAWLEHADRDGGHVGFVPWTPFDHPTLGRVEIGGFVPGFRTNPPADELDELAEGHAAFAAEMLRRRPRLALAPPQVRRLADGLYEIHVALVNEGGLPTATAMARQARAVPPTVIRLSAPPESIVLGDRVSRHWSVEAGGRAVQRWIVRGAPGDRLVVDIVSAPLGDRRLTFPLRD